MITQNTKKKIFLQYIDQKCLFGYNLEKKGIISGNCDPFGIQVFNLHNAIIPHVNVNPDLIKLTLRTIDQLTDEECIELAKIAGFNTTFGYSDLNERRKREGRILIEQYLKKQSNVYGKDWFEIYQYLLSIGIDLPSIHLGGKTLIESGLAININTLNP